MLVKRSVAGAVLTVTTAFVTTLTTSDALALTKQECIQASERGQHLRDEGKLADARQQFLTCTQESCPAPVAAACREDLATVEKRLPTLVLSARAANGSDLVDVNVQIDGVTVAQKLDGRAVMINPGPHKVRFEANGQVVEEQVVVIEGEKSRAVRVQFPGAPGETPTKDSTKDQTQQQQPTESDGIHPATWVFGGLAVASLGAFAYFSLSGSGEIKDMRDGCATRPEKCPQDDVDAAKTKLLIGDIFLVAGIVSAGAATYFALAPRSKSPAAVSVGVRGAGLELKARF